MQRGLDNGNSWGRELAGFTNQRQWYIDPRDQRLRIDKTAYLATSHHTDFSPVTCEVSLHQRRAQGKPTWLLANIKHGAEFDALAWKVGY